MGERPEDGITEGVSAPAAADRVHIVYELDRRQRLVAHLGVWLGRWTGVILIVGVPAAVLALAIAASPWFLALLLLPPFFNNLPRFAGGFVNVLRVRSQRMDLVLERDRIGFGTGREREWLPLEEIVRVERFGDVWVLLGGGVGIDVPVSALDERHIDRIRARIASRSRA